MQPSIPWSSSVSAFVIERMAIIHSLKCTVPFSLVVPLLSLAVLIAIYCHSLSLFASLIVTLCHSLSLFVTCCATRCHSLSFVVTLCTTPCHSSLFVCLFINDRSYQYLLSCSYCHWKKIVDDCSKLLTRISALLSAQYGVELST